MIKIKPVKLTSETPSATSTPLLRQHWSQERAYRTGKALTQATLGLTTIATIFNLIFAGPIEVAADIVILLGSGLSLYLTHLKRPRRYFVWWPVYVSLFVAVIPSTWFSGGLYSPWLGFYLSILTVAGALIQTEFSPLKSLIFALTYLLVWLFMGYAFPNQEAMAYVSSFPPIFMAVAAGICLVGVGYGLHRLIKSEKDLSAEIERQYAELFETRASLIQEESANQAKSAFLANISHELRTPLGAILGYAHLLQNSQCSAEEKEFFAQTIERNGQQLAHLVDDLLDLSKVEAGRIELEKLHCHFPDLIRDVINILEITARAKGVELPVVFLTPLPETIYTDPFRLKQIFTNILGNALKFTDRGQVSLALKYNEKASELVAVVKDTGRGISLEERKKLFKPFSQADPSMTRRYGGTGLGLNFSRELARLLGGDLDLTWSEIGSGSEFTIRIPVEVASDAKMISSFHATRRAAPPSLALEDNIRLEGIKVLVVDDARENRDIVKRYLSPAGAQVDEAADGVECLEKVELAPYDIVLMDVQMPGMDGLQATSMLRQRNFKGPIVAVTAHAMKQDRELCLAAGCDEHIAKPLRKAELIDVLLRRCIKHTEALSMPPPVEAAP